MNETRAYAQTAHASAVANDATVRIIANAREAVADGSATGRLATAITEVVGLIESGPPATPEEGQAGPAEKIEELAGAAEEQHRADPRWRKKRAGFAAGALLGLAVQWAAPAGFVMDRVEFVLQQLQDDGSRSITIEDSPGATVNINCSPNEEGEQREPRSR